jgi:hypothetical protein
MHEIKEYKIGRPEPIILRVLSLLPPLENLVLKVVILL